VIGMLHANTYQPDSSTSKQPSPTGLRYCVGVPCEACSVRTQCVLDEVLHSRLLWGPKAVGLHHQY
jgi:hypothetical protein